VTRVSGAAADAVAGGALFALAFATTLVAPSQLNLILTIDSPGANHVIIPVVYWIAATIGAAAIARATREAFDRALARVFVVAFVTHVLLLLAASASSILDRAAYATGFYWLYARAFYAAALAAAGGWVVGRVRFKQHDAEWFAVVPIALAAIVLAVVAFRRDPAVAAGGVTVGCVGGAMCVARAQSSAWWAAAREKLADDRTVAVAAFALALGLRLLYTARVMGDPNYLETGPDARFYDRLARGLVEGRSLVDNGYPLLILGHVRFLALIYRVFGYSYLAVCVVQSLMGAAAAAGIYLVGKPIFGAVAARIAAVFTAISFQLAFWAVAIGYQALDISLTMLLVWLLIAAIHRWPATFWVWALTGLVFGFAISVRETSSIFFAFACVWVLWAMTRRPWAERWRAVLALTAGAVVVLVPMVAPMVATSERRMAMRKHFDRLATGDVVPGREGLANPLSDPQAALTQLRERPGFVFRAEATAVQRNIAMQFFTQPYGVFDLVTLRKETDYYYGVWCYAYLLTLVGTIVAVRRIRAGDPESAALVMILGVIVSRTLPHLYLESGYRHRAPLEPFLILLCAAGVTAVLAAAWPARANRRPTLQAAS
jgi:hypothetical protein